MNNSYLLSLNRILNIKKETASIIPAVANTHRITYTLVGIVCSFRTIFNESLGILPSANQYQPSTTINIKLQFTHTEQTHTTDRQTYRQTDRQTDRQFIQTYTYSTSSQHKLYNEICHVYLHICEIKNEQSSVSPTVTLEKKNI